MTLALVLGVYAAFLPFYLPRLTNYTMGDREFSGWVSPIAERITRGDRPYVDFVLPIPPGSFALLSLIQRFAGRAALSQELWVAGVSRLLMGALGYAISRCFAPRKVALLVALTTLVLVTQTPKVCVYDHTSLVVGWLSVLAFCRAALRPDGKERRVAFGVAGALAAATLAFKQSTAYGLLAGEVTAFLYLVGAEWLKGRPERARLRLSDGGAVALGTLCGLALVVALVVALRGAPRDAFQAVIADAPALKGGTRALLRNLVTFFVANDAIRNTLAPTLAVALIGFGVRRAHGTLHVGARAEEPFPASAALLVGGAALVTYGGAIALLATEHRELGRKLVAGIDALRNVPAYGFVFGAAFFASHLAESNATSDEARDRGHVLNAVLLSTLVASLVYDTSFVSFYPFYYNEPTIPIALTCLYLATERSGLRWATPLVLVPCVLPTYGVELNRALSTDTRVLGGFWSGLHVNYRGVEVLHAAARAQELAGPNGSVLVVPEDLEIAGLIQRPRPPIRGAVLFVDQYPKRLAKEDIRTLDAHPPNVIVVHPRRASDWRGVFSTWQKDSGAEQVIDHVLEKLLPARYSLEDSFSSIYFWDHGEIDVYTLREDQAE
ncbi:MAG TPA: hypothetical protein VHE30_10610 [Polyangiaceae bacterium]|nr:hypothetical protein [Polyangiaceae bacterium]